MRFSQKHLIQCTCILPQFKKSATPVFHQFIVHSELEDEEFIPSYVKCNNCAAVHHVIDICKSSISYNKDDTRLAMTIKDVKLSLPQKLCDLLETYQIELPSWQDAKFIIENQQWGSIIILTREDSGGVISGKCLKILGPEFFRVEQFSRSDVFG